MPVPHHSSFFTGQMPFVPIKQPHQSMKGMPHNETQFPCNRGQRVVKRLCECVLGFVQAADAVVKPRKVGLGGVSPGCRLRVSARRDTCCPSRQAEPVPVHAGCRAPRRTSRAALEYLCTSTFIQVPSVVWRCWLGGRKGIRPVKTEWWGAGVVICLEVQTCIWPSWCHCHSLSLASAKSRLVLPFWDRLTWVVPEKGR